MRFYLLRVFYIRPRQYSASTSNDKQIYEPEQYQEVVPMGIYTAEVLSTAKTAIESHIPKGDSHIVPGHETGGCIEEYHEIPSNLRPIGT
jgi:hypothetical protein